MNYYLIKHEYFFKIMKNFFGALGLSTLLINGGLYAARTMQVSRPHPLGYPCLPMRLDPDSLLRPEIAQKKRKARLAQERRARMKKQKAEERFLQQQQKENQEQEQTQEEKATLKSSLPQEDKKQEEQENFLAFDKKTDQSLEK